MRIGLLYNIQICFDTNSNAFLKDFTKKFLVIVVLQLTDVVSSNYLIDNFVTINKLDQ